MPRPIKQRRICELPDTTQYGPYHKEDISDAVTLTLEEYEVIRLIDYEGYDQTKCADQIGVGRSTVQRIYESARKKIAECIVAGKRMEISGGNYKVCGGPHPNKRCRYCPKFNRDGEMK